METMEQASRRPWDPSRLHFEFPIADKESRLKELVVYICHQCLDDPTFSKVKLYKILFYSEFQSYGRYREPITGVSYKKLPFGPGPAIYQRLQQEMVRDRLIRIVGERVYDFDRQRFLPLKDPSVDLFRARDISLVEQWIREFWGKSARDVSEFSHGKAWHIAKLYEPIPYEAVYISDEPVTIEDVERAKELASKHSWKL
jgi:Protein of unknown function (DUF4065)